MGAHPPMASVPPGPPETTLLLRAARDGDARAADALLPLVYNELRRIAQARVAQESAGFTLGATGLVHEAYLRLVVGADVEWADRAHFMAVASQAMRRILTDRARARRAQKRGGVGRPVTLDVDRFGAEPEPDDVLLAVDEALGRLAADSAELAKVVELRFFGGLEVAEVAELLQVSPRTAARMWTRARAHLRSYLGPESSS